MDCPRYVLDLPTVLLEPRAISSVGLHQVDAALQLHLAPLVWSGVEEKHQHPPAHARFLNLQPCQEMFQKTNNPELLTPLPARSRYTWGEWGLLSRVLRLDEVPNLTLALELSHLLSLMGMLTTRLMLTLGTTSSWPALCLHTSLWGSHLSSSSSWWCVASPLCTIPGPPPGNQRGTTRKH